MIRARLLIAGIGNIFLGDDAFGVEVVRGLLARRWPVGVQVTDFGIRGFDLVHSLLNDWEAVILVDAVPRGGEAGTLYVIEPEWDATPGSQANPAIDAHQMDPSRVLRLAAEMGCPRRNTLIVGCEPAPLEGHDMLDGLSPAVAAAVPRAVELVLSIAAQLLAGEEISASEESLNRAT
jgi:hydrogenase maturation protease